MSVPARSTGHQHVCSQQHISVLRGGQYVCMPARNTGRQHVLAANMCTGWKRESRWEQSKWEQSRWEHVPMPARSTGHKHVRSQQHISVLRGGQYVCMPARNTGRQHVLAANMCTGWKRESRWEQSKWEHEPNQRTHVPVSPPHGARWKHESRWMEYESRWKHEPRSNEHVQGPTY
eukprot:SAG25_NODE_229_length_11447_cov_5.927476_2_plen_176_part_00